MKSFLLRVIVVVAMAVFTVGSVVHGKLIWPTPNPAFQDGQSVESFIQPTASGVTESGLFGCVRNNGRRFHEGIDLYPISKNKRGEATDAIYSVLPGRIAYINQTPGYSNYGRYVVIEHDGESPAFHTLYAHLASVDENLSVGSQVESGTSVGIMGRSASSTIPRSRAHLHFEIGFRLTDQFQVWYDRQKFSSKNRHGFWNGMNLVSIDPLEFYQSVRSGKVATVGEYLKLIPTYARIRVHTTVIPDFVEDYPALVTRSYSESKLIAWDIAFSQYGVPKEWTPRFAHEAIVGESGDVEIIAYNPELLKEQTCNRVLILKGSKPKVSTSTLNTLKKLFGFR